MNGPPLKLGSLKACRNQTPSFQAMRRLWSASLFVPWLLWTARFPAFRSARNRSATSKSMMPASFKRRRRSTWGSNSDV